MNNINGISFGAYLALQNNSLYKHVDIETVNKFARDTKDIPGIMTLKKSQYGNLEAVLNGNKEQRLLIDADEFYAMKSDKQAVVMKKMAQYMNALISFRDRVSRQYGYVSDTMIKKQIKRLDKIIGNEKAFALDHKEITDTLKEGLRS